MKKIINAALLSIMTAIIIFPAYALEPGYTYQCAKLKNPVTVDGKVSGTEWDDANALIVNSDNETFKVYGEWQGGNNPKTAADLSVTYKLSGMIQAFISLSRDTIPSLYGGRQHRRRHTVETATAR